MKNATKLSIFLFMFLAVFFTASFACGQYYNNYYNYNNCTYHAYRLCSGNNIYWYDSCGNQQDLFQACLGTNLTCQYGQCVYQAPTPNPYAAHYKIACASNSLYWFDSLGIASGLYKNCQDANSCTFDSCSDSKCYNVLKCDGATCAAGSADYNSFCAGNNSGSSQLSVSFFAKQDKNSSQWQKTVAVGSSGSVYFMISVANNSGSQIDNVNVLANIPNEIASLGNLKVNEVSVSGDIVSGINIGSLAQGTAKSVTFEGKTQTILTQAAKQATAKANISGASQFSDSVAINLNPGQASGASVSSSSASSGFWLFLKRWYLWILVGLVLIFLFVVVFRRLSSNV